MNICVTGLDYEKVIDVSNIVAKTINYNYIDAKNEFEPLLLNSVNYPTILMDDLLQVNETKILIELSKMINCVISVPADMYLSNKNYKIFANSLTILLICENLSEIDLKIQNSIKKQCKFSVSNNDEALNVIKGEQ